MEAWSSRALEERCRRSDMEVWSSGRLGMELWRRVVCVATWRCRGGDWRRGDLEASCQCTVAEVCRHGPLDFWRRGDLEARCRCSDVGVWRRGPLELWNRAAAGNDVEVWASGGVAVCRYGALEV